MDGVLKSLGAVPKEPPLEKGTKRCAYQWEDHDMAYAGFHGTIPKGQYGAGTVKIWDSGTYELVEKTGDKIITKMGGKKLKGEYVLLKFRKAGEKEWLLFKR